MDPCVSVERPWCPVPAMVTALASMMAPMISAAPRGLPCHGAGDGRAHLRVKELLYGLKGLKGQTRGCHKVVRYLLLLLLLLLLLVMGQGVVVEGQAGGL